jgi:hypothetical protein
LLNLAFVLLSEAKLSDAGAIAMAFRDFADAGETAVDVELHI